MDDYISRQAAVEIIKNYCENGCDIAEDNWCPSCQREQFIKLLKALPSAQPEPRWIPAEIEPPKERRSYWVCTDTGYQYECRWTNNRFGMFESEWGWKIFDIPQYTKVVAYMPLPKPYERSEDV